ncbi:ATP synthase F1 subunit delta [Candidatus Peregrinibacteria bacterium]|nr:ATP synthase F1 subunit delta [Candidatus Peregrinibacteria bacterium]
MKISSKKYAQALIAALENAGDPKPMIKNLLNLLRKKHQLKLLPKILQAFEEQWNQAHDIVKMEVSCPKKFESSLQVLEKSLEGAPPSGGKKLIFKPKIDDSLMGGFKIRSGDTLIDASLKTRLKKLEHRIISI